MTNLRLAVVAAALAAVSFYACGSSTMKSCKDTGCSIAETCNLTTGLCVPKGAGGGAGGGGGGVGGGGGTSGCNPTNCYGCCAGSVCNPGNTKSACGSAGATCASCSGTDICGIVTQSDGGAVDAGNGLPLIACGQPGAGGGAGGGGATGGGAGGGGATGGGAGGGGATGGGAGGGGSTGGGAGGGGGGGGGLTDAGFPYCVPRTDGGLVTCTTECQRGFHCETGVCVLNGAGGPVQVTLRWNDQEDLDLHVDEPTDAGPCEIWYGDTNNVDAGSSPSSCGAQGILDLDSEPACPSPPDYVDVENIIYPSGSMAPKGTYTVRVDHYMNCNMSLTAVPFQVEVRNNGVVSGMCGVFVPTDADWDDSASAGGGRQVMTFVVP